jgi:sugar phosphate isomerase/epimerase
VKFACGDHSFPLLEHAHVCDLIRMLGFDAIDIGVMGNRSHIRPEVIREDVAGWAGRLRERVDARGLEIADVFLIPWSDYQVMAPNHPDSAERRRSAQLFDDILDFSVALGVSGMTILPGMEFDGESHERSLERAAQELSPRVQRARESGIRLSVEPHTDSLVENPHEARRLVEMTPGLEVTLDHTHFIRLGYSLEDVAPLVPHTRHYHARCARPGRLQTRMGENTIDFEAVVDALRDADYDGYLAVEYVWTEWEHCNECDNVSETVLLRDRLRAAVTGERWVPYVSTI